MLFLHDDRAPRAWSSGSASLVVDAEHDAQALPLAVRCRFGSLKPELALLDTGSEWSVVGGEAAELLDAELGPERRALTLDSRRGVVRGALHGLRMELIANQGENLIIDGVCLIAPSWSGPSVVGFRGFLERIRLAVDPSGSEVRAFFGPLATR